MPEGGFVYPNEGLSWELYVIAATAIARAGYGEVDAEDTLMIQLTTHELGMFTLGCQLAARLFPELYPIALGINKKIIELADVQQYFAAESSDEGGTPDEE